MPQNIQFLGTNETFWNRSQLKWGGCESTYHNCEQGILGYELVVYGSVSLRRAFCRQFNEQEVQMSILPITYSQCNNPTEDALWTCLYLRILLIFISWAGKCSFEVVGVRRGRNEDSMRD